MVHFLVQPERLEACLKHYSMWVFWKYWNIQVLMADSMQTLEFHRFSMTCASLYSDRIELALYVTALRLKRERRLAMACHRAHDDAGDDAGNSDEPDHSDSDRYESRSSINMSSYGVPTPRVAAWE